MSTAEQVFVSWEEHIIPYELGGADVRFYVKGFLGRLVLAVVGTEENGKQGMTYAVSEEFMKNYGHLSYISAGSRWQTRTEVIDWLEMMISKNQELLQDLKSKGLLKVVEMGNYYKQRDRVLAAGCCRTCNRDSASYRFQRAHCDNLLMQEPQKQAASEEGWIVDFHFYKSLSLITVNAPPDFHLNLDFLPCFMSPDQVNEPYKKVLITLSLGGFLLFTTKLYQTDYYICNPVNKEWIRLPDVPRKYPEVHTGFVFDPCNTSGCRKLQCRDCRFMVVRILDDVPSFRARSHFEAETFSSDTGEWTVDVIPSLKEFCWGERVSYPKSYLLNKCLHWEASEGRIVVYDPYKKLLYGTISGPKRDEACLLTFSVGGLFLCRGSLWLLSEL